MKKLIALMIVLSMLFVLVACSQPCVNHIDEDHDQKCDVCEVDVECTDHKDEDGNYICDYCLEDITPEGIKLSQGVATQLKGAKSAKIEYEFNVEENEDSWYYDNDNEARFEENDSKIKSKVYITFAKTETLVNVQIESETFEYDEDTQKWEIDSERRIEVALVDGVLYQAFDDGYFVSQDTEMTQAVELLSALLEGVEPTEDEIAEMYKVFGEKAITSFNIFENKGSSVIDFKPIVESFEAYINDIDFNTYTMGELIDDLLVNIDPELTTEIILEEMGRVGALTVNEALAEIDVSLTAQYNTTIQGIYDSIVNDPRFAIFLQNYVEYMAEQTGAEVSEEDINTQSQTMLTDIKAFKLADYITELGIGEAAIYELFISLVSSGNETEIEPPTLEQLLMVFEQDLAMTIAEFEEMFPIPVFTSIKEMLAGLEIRELSARLDVQFKGIFEIDNITATIKSDTTSTTDSVVEGKQDVFTQKFAITVKLYDISTTDIVINAPAEDRILIIPVDDWIYGAEVDSYGAQYMIIYHNYENYFSINVNLVTEVGELFVTADFEGFEKLASTTITIPAEDISMHNLDYDWCYPEDDTPLVVEYNIESGEFTIKSMPAYTYPKMSVANVINAIGFGEGTDNSEKYDIDPALGAYFSWIVNNSDFLSGLIKFKDKGIGYEFEYYSDVDGSMVCTIIGIYSQGGLIKPTTGNGFIGTNYDEENLEAYFGSNRDFTIYLSADGLVSIDELPEINPEYFT